MGVLEQLERPLFPPSKLDRVFMQYVREHINDVPHTPIAQLAQESGVSEATITRFAKKMGFENLQAYKFALATELAGTPSRHILSDTIEVNEPALETGRKLLDVNIATLEKTLATLPPSRIEECADLIMGAERVLFIGLGNSGYIALDCAYRFFTIGLKTHGSDNSHEFIMEAGLARRGDVFLAISHSGHSPEILKAIRLARKNGAAVIAITSDDRSQLLREADLTLVYQARESRLERGSIMAKLAQYFVIDLLYTQIVKEMAEDALENRKKAIEAVDLLR